VIFILQNIMCCEQSFIYLIVKKVIFLNQFEFDGKIIILLIIVFVTLLTYNPNQ